MNSEGEVSSQLRWAGRIFAAAGWVSVLLSPWPLILFFILLPFGMALTGGGHGSLRSYHFGALPTANAVGLATLFLLFGLITARAGASLARGEEQGRSTLESLCRHSLLWAAFYIFFPSPFLEAKFWRAAHPLSHGVHLVGEYLVPYLVGFAVVAVPFWLAWLYLRRDAITAETGADDEPSDNRVWRKGTLPVVVVTVVVLVLALASGSPLLSDDFFYGAYTTSDEREKAEHKAKEDEARLNKERQDSDAIFNVCLPQALVHPELLGELDGRQPVKVNHILGVTRNADGTATLRMELKNPKHYYALWARCTARQSADGSWEFVQLQPPLNEPHIKQTSAPVPAGPLGQADASIDLSGVWVQGSSAGSCDVGFGLLIEHVEDPRGAYSIAKCLGEVCEPPQRHYANSFITGAPNFHVLTTSELRMRDNNGWATYTRCPGAKASIERH